MTEYLFRIQEDKEELTRAVSKAIYVNAVYRLPDRVKRLKIGGSVLMSSFVVGSVLIVLSYLL